MSNAAQAVQKSGSNPGSPSRSTREVVLELQRLRTELQNEFLDGPGAIRRAKLLQAIEAIDLSVELWLGRV